MCNSQDNKSIIPSISLTTSSHCLGKSNIVDKYATRERQTCNVQFLLSERQACQSLFFRLRKKSTSLCDAIRSKYFLQTFILFLLSPKRFNSAMRKAAKLSHTRADGQQKTRNSRKNCCTTHNIYILENFYPQRISFGTELNAKVAENKTCIAHNKVSRL